jgi:hypothetical protein
VEKRGVEKFIGQFQGSIENEIAGEELIDMSGRIEQLEWTGGRV